MADRRNYGKGGAIVFVATVLALTGFLGVVPLWQFFSVRVGTHAQTAVVVRHYYEGSTAGPAAGTVEFRLPDGRKRTTYWPSLFPPDRGDTIKVFYDDKIHDWMSPGYYGWSRFVRGAIFTLLGLLLIVWAIAPRRVRRRAQPSA